MNRFATPWSWLLACCLLPVLSGCQLFGKKEAPPSPNPVAKSLREQAANTTNPAEQELLEDRAKVAEAAARSLVDPMAEFKNVPVAWNLSRDGSHLLGLLSKSNPMEHTIASWDLRQSGKLKHMLLAKTTTEGLRAFLVANTDGSQALVASLHQLEAGAVTDKYWITGNGTGLTPVDHLRNVQLPGDLTFDALDTRPSLLSMDGGYLLVPVGTVGVIVTELASGANRYAALPDFGDFPPQSVRMNVLPTLDGTPYVYITQYALVSMATTEGATLTQVEADLAQLSILNLKTLKWEKTRRFDWLPLELGSPDFHTQPWLMLGSRRKEVNTEQNRMAKAARLDPATDLELIEPYLGGLAWDGYGGMRVTPDASRIIYKDYLQDKVMRITLADGAREEDASNYLHDGGLLLSDDGETVLMVQGNVVLRCEFAPVEAGAGNAQ